MINEWAEIDQRDIDRNGFANCPTLAFDTNDYNYLQMNGTPYLGMSALGSNGFLYQYTISDNLNLGSLDGIRKFFKKIKRAGKKAKKKFTKTKFGKAVVRVAKKVKPIARKMGPWMVRLAPVANAIPGVGPVVSKAMAATGKIGMAMEKYGAVAKQIKAVSKKTGKIANTVKISIPKKNAKKLKSELQRAAAEIKKRNPRDIKRLAKLIDNTPVNSRIAKSILPVKPPSKSSIAAAKKISRLIQKENAIDYARNDRNPLYQRQKAMRHAQKLAQENMRQIREAAISENKNGVAKHTLNAMRTRQINERKRIKQQIAMLQNRLNRIGA